MSDSSWSVTWRDVIVPLLCPEWGAQTFIFGIDSGNTRPQRVVLRREREQPYRERRVSHEINESVNP